MAENPLGYLIRKLRSRSPIGAAAEAALLTLPYVRKTYQPTAYLVREGSIELTHCSLIVSGYAIRQKLTAEGMRQIVSLNMRGDLLDLQHLFLDCADHNVQALTELHTVNIDRRRLRDVLLQQPELAEAMWIELAVEGSIFREWVVNVGRRDARGRVAHLLCEFAMRSQAAGLTTDYTCELPMTQEQVGDATGLTAVHVNRTLKALEQQRVIRRTGRMVTFDDWDAIRDVAGFSALYLHNERVKENAGD